MSRRVSVHLGGSTVYGKESCEEGRERCGNTVSPFSAYYLIIVGELGQLHVSTNSVN
jgi:hypothetical protein